MRESLKTDKLVKSVLPTKIPDLPNHFPWNLEIMLIKEISCWRNILRCWFLLEIFELILMTWDLPHVFKHWSLCIKSGICLPVVYLITTSLPHPFTVNVWHSNLEYSINFTITSCLYSICYYIYVFYIINPRKHAQFLHLKLEDEWYKISYEQCVCIEPS